MGLSKKKIKEAEEQAKLARKKKIEEIIKMGEIKLPDKPYTYSKKIPRSAAYQDFLKEIKREPTTIYEKACAFSEKILPIKLDKKLYESIENNLKAAYIVATPRGVVSLTILTSIILSFILIFSFLLGFGSTGTLVLMLFTAVAIWYIYDYPRTRAKVVTLKMSSDSVLAILYMITYMRGSPNLEGAIKFAASNLEGPLQWDLKKLLWDIEVGKYKSANEALQSYIEKWKDINREFAEALHVLRGATYSKRRIYDEALRVILDGTRERTKHYVAGLRMPIMLLHAMGVLLPIMGLVLFPIVLIFMADAVKPIFLFIGYDILLPLTLIFFINYILQSKPPTFSQPDISMAKGIPKLGYFSIGKRQIPILPIALIIGLPIISFGLSGFSNPDIYLSVTSSIFVIFGISLSISVYCLMDAWQKIKIRKNIERIETEFSIALFQLGTTISSGEPLELSLDKAREKMKNLKISEMFEIASNNMKKFGYTFEQAFFDKDVGAIWYFPSKLIISIMRSIIESSRKGVKIAADSMITISNYLKNVHEVKEDVNEILGETLSSMKFLSMFLAPMIAGVTVTMAVVIIQILTNIGSTIGSLGLENANVAQSMLINPWLLSGGISIAPPAFQMIVGIYMLIIAILLSIFVNKIQYGDDAVGMRMSIGKIVLIAFIVYFMSWLLVYNLFGNPIQALLAAGYV
ncbi:MAG: hypothetical protein J7K26_03370 [Candidatus Aenigmarchaeota archaeon]|nr:hypothetical protein [Candidatus Aenigmarchaeota archaeon]